MLRDFLINRKSSKEVFGTRGFQSVAESVEAKRKMRSDDACCS